MRARRPAHPERRCRGGDTLYCYWNRLTAGGCRRRRPGKRAGRRPAPFSHVRSKRETGFASPRRVQARGVRRSPVSRSTQGAKATACSGVTRFAARARRFAASHPERRCRGGDTLYCYWNRLTAGGCRRRRPGKRAGRRPAPFSHVRSKRETGFASPRRVQARGVRRSPVSRSTQGAKATAWSGRRDSNPRPTAWKAVTLPLSYSRTPAKRRSGGGGWIRTIVGLSPTDLQSVAFDRSATPPATSSVEPAPGFEPRTYCLQGSCSTN